MKNYKNSEPDKNCPENYKINQIKNRENNTWFL
jgi:hypothetical protein